MSAPLFRVRVVCTKGGHRERVLEKFDWADALAYTDDELAHFPSGPDYDFLREPLPMMTDGRLTFDRTRLRQHQSFRWTCKTCRTPYQFTYDTVARAIERHAEARTARLDVATIG